MSRSIAAIAAFLVVSVSVVALHAAPREYEVRLTDAVFRGQTPEDEPHLLILLLGRDEQGWRRVCGVARDMTERVQTGHVLEASVNDRAMTFELAMPIHRGGDQPVAHATYAIKVEAAPDGNFRGRFNGAYRGHEVEGDAHVRVLPPHRQPDDDFEPIKPGEHPRLLFRADELETLRRRAKTPMGKAAMARMSGTVGEAVKYAITGDRKHAMKIIPGIEAMMRKGLQSDQFGHNVGDRLEQTAIAYDLCRDVWPEDLRKRVENYLLQNSEGVLRAERTAGSGINWHVCSNWSAPLYAGAAQAGLVLWGEPGPKPAAPQPVACGMQAKMLKGVAVPDGVPVSPFQSGVMPDEWLQAGGFQGEQGDDPLAEAKDRPKNFITPGYAITHEGHTDAFKPLSREKDKGYYRIGRDPGVEMIDITNACGRRLYSTNYFFTVIENDIPRWVRFDSDFADATLMIGDMAIEPGAAFRLGKGKFPMLVRAWIGWMNPWGRHLMRPRLTEITEAQAAAITQRAQAEYEAARKVWQLDLAEWKRTGGQNIAYRKLAAKSRFMMYMFCREAVGTGGFQAELSHYSNIASLPPLRYAAAHRRVRGYDVSSQDDITMLLPRKVFSHVYGFEDGPRAQEINGYPEANSAYFAHGLPIAPEKWQPALLWAWHQQLAAEKGDSLEATLLSPDPVAAFLYYPRNMEPRQPAGILPLTWRAPDLGWYGFRNAWDGRDDFVTQVFLKAHYIGGWNAANGGAFRLRGLGHVWAVGNRSRNRHRGEESVVVLPEAEELNLGACAKATHVLTREDGSGVISMDLNDIHAKRIGEVDGRRVRNYTRYGGMRYEEAFGDSGIRAMRSFAVDYSGKSGAPCLIAIVDRFKGGGRKVWQWQLPEGDERAGRKGDIEHTSIDGGIFTVRKPDGASMRGTFVTRHELAAERRMTTMRGGGGSSAGKLLERPIEGVFAEGGEAFFVVITIQKGDAPPVAIKGSGLDAVVRVGKQTVRFDGEKIILGK